MAGAVNRQYADAVVKDAEALHRLLSRFPDDVQAFMRRQFQLSLYPLKWVEEFATALNEFRSRS